MTPQSKDDLSLPFNRLSCKDGARDKIHSGPLESLELQDRKWPLGKAEGERTFQPKYPGVVPKHSTPSNR